MTLKRIAVSLACSLIAVSAYDAKADVDIKLEPFVTGVNAPLMMVQAPGDERIFVVEQWGRIRIVQNGRLRPEPFLDLRSKILPLHHDFDERGLLGLAFHPNFQENGKFYVAYSGHLDFQQDLAHMLWYSHTNKVSEFQISEINPNAADPNTERVITSINWPQFNHNGHWIGFGPDGYLYISTGDGGYANDWGIGHNVTIGNGQDLRSLNGKMLRIDVDRSENGNNYAIPSDNPFVGDDEALDEIWAYGLRNAWRCSFDMENGDLICGDVQQNSYEEVSIIPKGGNLGWRRMEASHCFDYVKPDQHPENCDTEGLVMPILEYENCTAKPQNCKGISVTGGYVHRGEAEALNGKYIFGDWSKSFAETDGQLFVASKGDNGEWTMEQANVTNMDDKLPYILAFGQDANGDVYALTSVTTGPNGGLDTIYKIVPGN